MKWYGRGASVGGARQAAHHAVDAVELIHGLRPLGAGVVGDLVVAQVVGVDDGRPAAHLADDEVDEHVAHDRGGRRLEHREGHARVDARPDVAHALSPRLEVLSTTRLPDELDGAAGEVVGVHQEQAEAANLEALAAAWTSWLLVAMARVAPPLDEVADAGAAVAEQVTLPVVLRRRPPLDLVRVVGMVGDHQVVAFLLPPAEGRDAGVGAVQDADLPGRGHRGRQGLPLAQPVLARAQPLGDEGHVPGAQRVAQDGLGKAVDLEDDEPGPRPVVHIPAVAGHALEGVAVERLVLVEPDDRGEARCRCRPR